MHKLKRKLEFGCCLGVLEGRAVDYRLECLYLVELLWSMHGIKLLGIVNKYFMLWDGLNTSKHRNSLRSDV